MPYESKSPVGYRVSPLQQRMIRAQRQGEGIQAGSHPELDQPEKPRRTWLHGVQEGFRSIGRKWSGEPDLTAVKGRIASAQAQVKEKRDIKTGLGLLQKWTGVK
jgi:hypothetical protein